MRAFIAINFEDQVKDKILEVEQRLCDCAVQGTFSREQNFHLTLAFLGEVKEEQVPMIKAAMDQISFHFFSLTFAELGCFRRGDGGDIWWLGFRKSGALLSLQEQLCEELEKQGFVLEKKKFKPHLTLARQVTVKEEPDRTVQPFAAKVTQISLMKSERIGSQLTYTPVFTRRFRP